jgi:hypothetical protein
LAADHAFMAALGEVLGGWRDETGMGRDGVKLEHIVRHCHVSKVELEYIGRHTCNVASRSTVGGVSDRGKKAKEKED